MELENNFFQGHSKYISRFFANSRPYLLGIAAFIVIWLIYIHIYMYTHIYTHTLLLRSTCLLAVARSQVLHRKHL